ncbi:replication factor-a protein [Multifurca ochricompacta]|uniref:Replication protein A subunit n=1 Tax=Multifurca ochricompacta TaxID=376703 RepID=A0AAD4QS05_9AGAM|nr:replication factor-a protein [Multifurca ochricompacta]
MSNDNRLSEGICQRLNSGDKDDEPLWNSKPTLQFLSIKKVVAVNNNDPSNNPGSTTADRYRIIISDGLHFLQAMLATQLNYLVEEDLITKNTLAVIETMSCQHILDKRLVILLSLRVLQRESPKIGNPAPLTMTPPQPKTDGVSSPGTVASVSSSTVPQSHNQQAGNRTNPIYPIVALTPYQNNWRIKARVVQKSDIRHYSNQRGEGRFFSVTFMDESGEIKGTAWNAVVDDLYEKLRENHVYLVSKARVNLAKKKFSTVSNDYELSLDRGTEIEECHDADAPVIRYNFVNLSGLQDLQKEAICDVVVVVKEVSDLSEINTRNNKVTQKRDLVVVDNSGFSVRLTLWGKQAEQFNTLPDSVIAFKGVRVNDFNGRSLSLLSSGAMTIGPDIPEAHTLKGWYMDGGAQASFNSHTQARSLSGPGGTINRSDMRTINDVREAQLGMSDKPDFFSTRATIMHIKTDNILYPACPTPQCNKKVTESHDGWRCEKCDRSFEKPEYRYIISMAVGDHTGQIWLSGFNDEENAAKANHIIHSATCNMYSFACKASQHSFNDQNRVRYGIQRMQPLDYLAESRSLIELLHSALAR